MGSPTPRLSLAHLARVALFASGLGVALATPAAARGPDSLADEAAAVSDAVVNISATQTVEEKKQASNDDSDSQQGPQGQQGTPFDDLFDEFFKKRHGDDAPHHGERQSNSLGSGFVVDPKGIIITNNHVIADANEITVIFTDGQKLRAKVLGTDTKVDVAVLQVKPEKPLKSVKFGDSEAMRVGDWVMAVGNPFGLGGTVTAGIVSARGRDIGAGPYDDFLQIDAPVNRGNSGGPTFNADGQVVGVNTAIFSPSGGSVGIGFAIPSEVAQNVIQSLETNGKVSRGWIGVQIQPVTDEIADSLGLKTTKGALVAEAQPTGPASAAGIKSGDVILGVDGKNVDGPRELARTIAGLGPDAKATLTYWHNGSEKTTDVKLGMLPNSDQVAKAEVQGDDDKATVGALGLQLAPAASIPGAGQDGVVVADVEADSQAAQKGLKVGDVILEAGGQKVSKPADITAVISQAKKDGRKAVLLRIKNDQGVHFVALGTTANG